MTLRLRVWLSTLAVSLLPGIASAQHHAGHYSLAPVALEARRALGELRWDLLDRVATLTPPMAMADPAAEVPMPAAAEPAAVAEAAARPSAAAKQAAAKQADEKRPAGKHAANRRATSKRAANRLAAAKRATDTPAAAHRVAAQQAAPPRFVPALDQCPGLPADPSDALLSGFVITDPVDLAAATDPVDDVRSNAPPSSTRYSVASAADGSCSPVIVTLRQAEEYVPYDLAAFDRLKLRLFPYGVPHFVSRLLAPTVRPATPADQVAAHIKTSAAQSPDDGSTSAASTVVAAQRPVPVDCLLDELVWRGGQWMADHDAVTARLRPYELGRLLGQAGVASTTAADRWVERLAAGIAKQQPVAVGPPAPAESAPLLVAATDSQSAATALGAPSVCCPVEFDALSVRGDHQRQATTSDRSSSDLRADVLRAAAGSLESLAAAMRSLSDQLDPRSIASQPVAGPHVR